MCVQKEVKIKKGMYFLCNIQLNCPAIRHQDYVIIFAVEVRFQIGDQFWIPYQTLHRTCYLFFVNPQNMLV